MVDATSLDGEAVRHEPPRGVGPALAGVILDGTAGMREIAVMLVDLSLRGWFTMETEGGQTSLVTATSLPPSGAAPSAAEQLLMGAIFRPSPVDTPGSDVAPQVVSMTSLRHRLQGHVDEICAALGDEVVDAGLMTRNPTRRGLRRRGGLLTPAGQEAREQAAGYRRYLSRAEAASRAAFEGPDVMGAQLSYAIALDVLPRWAESLEALDPGGSSPAAAMLHDLRNNPVLVGVAGSGGFSLDDLMTLQVARNMGARFPSDHR